MGNCMTSAPESPTTLTVANLADHVGREVGVSDWLNVDQPLIDDFARVTGDRQWIHVDAGRARQTPFGGTIAHGFLTLSLLPQLLADGFHVEGASAAMNYGLNRLRFPSVLPSGSRIRARTRLAGTDSPSAGGLLATYEVTVEREGGERPVLVAELLVLYR